MQTHGFTFICLLLMKKSPRTLLSTALFLAGSTLLSAHDGQADSLNKRGLTHRLHYQLTWQGSTASGKSPLWFTANRYGLSTLKPTNGYVRAAMMRPLECDSDRRWGIGYGIDLALPTGFTSQFVVQQAFIEARWLYGVVTIGAKEQPMELKDNRLSSGSQTLGINARPVPQVRLSLPEYWILPFTGRWLRLKGHVAFGKTTDDTWQHDFTQGQNRYTKGVLFHSKAGYLMIGKPEQLPFSLELGLEMACQFGGKSFIRQGNQMVEIKNQSGLRSFWNAFFPGGSDATDGKFVNKEGNHLGSWVARFNYDNAQWGLSCYADQYFEDNSSMIHINKNGWGKGADAHKQVRSKYFAYDFKDWMLGAELRLKATPWLRKLVAEYLYTKYQGGPVYHDHTANINEHICGRDSYYNHYLFTGWQHWGMTMGNPLYMSPLYNTEGTVEVKNNRFVAWHFGAEGSLQNGLDYRLLATYQKGYGTYYDFYPDPKEDFSLMLEARYTCPEGMRFAGWSVTGAFGLDAGKLYGNNIGGQITLSKSGIFNIKRTRK